MNLHDVEVEIVVLDASGGAIPTASIVFPVEDVRFQAVLVASLSGFLAMVLFVIISLDRPFHGAMAIPADSYQLIYDQLMKR